MTHPENPDTLAEKLERSLRLATRLADNDAITPALAYLADPPLRPEEVDTLIGKLQSKRHLVADLTYVVNPATRHAIESRLQFVQAGINLLLHTGRSVGRATLYPPIEQGTDDDATTPAGAD
jgi:hypothetical protein